MHMNRRLAIAALFIAVLVVVAIVLVRPRIKPSGPTTELPPGKSEALPQPDSKKGSGSAPSAVQDKDHPVLEVVDENLAPIEDAIACMDLGMPALGRSGPDGLVAWTAD